MAPIEIATLDELRPQLRKTLGSFDHYVQDEVIDELKHEFETANPPMGDADVRAINKALNEEDVYYAIREEDLQLIKEAAVAAAALWTLLNNPVGVIGGLVALLYRYRRNRVQLKAEQALVLQTLKRAPREGWAVSEIAAQIPGKKWSEQEVSLRAYLSR